MDDCYNSKQLHLYIKILAIILWICIFDHVRATPSLDSLSTEWGKIYYAPQEKGLAKTTSKKVSNALSHLQETLRFESTGTFTVIIAPDRHMFQKYAGPLPSWAAGATNYQRNVVIMKSPTYGRSSIWEYDETLRHEITHVIIGQYISPDRLPRWLHEGIAMVNAGQQSIRTTYLLSQAVLREDIIPLNELESLLGYDKSRAALGYAESLSAVQFLLTRFPTGTLECIFVHMKEQESSFAQAFQAVTGLTQYYFQYHWMKYLKNKYRWISILSSETTLWILFPLLALLGYLVIRWRNKKKLAQWEDEEQAMNSETDWEFEYMPDPDDEWRGDIH